MACLHQGTGKSGRKSRLVIYHTQMEQKLSRMIVKHQNHSRIIYYIVIDIFIK